MSWLKCARCWPALRRLGSGCIAALLALPAQAQQDRRFVLDERRVALVFGNDAYKFSPLRNAVADAAAMRAAFVKLGFNVTLATNLTLREMNEAVSSFLARIEPGSTAAFYYAGHGVQLQGENFLIPVEFNSTSEADVRYMALSASRLLDLIQERKPRVKVMILDACRNNPFQRARQLGGGLAPMEGGEGTIVAYAAEHGKTAADDGLFRRALAAEIVRPGIDLRDVFRSVKEQVFRSSGRRQLPYVYEGLVGKVTLQGGAADPVPQTNVVSEPAPNDPVARPLPVGQDKLADDYRRLKAQADAILQSVRATEDDLRKSGLGLRPEIAAARGEVLALAEETARALAGSAANAAGLLDQFRAAVDRLSQLVFRRPLSK